jgi:plasmid stabilization system protein ParE
LESAYEYIAQENLTAAGNLIERILSAVEMLENRPQMGRKGRVPGTSELVITGTPFVVAYRLHDGWIEVLAVLHGARRWPSRL